MPGALGFQQAQRLAVITPQHVVHEAFSLVVRHAGNLELRHVRGGGVPAGFAQIEVDEAVAGGGFVVVVRVRLGGVAGAGLGHFRPQALQFAVQVAALGQDFRQLAVAGTQFDFQFLQLRPGLLRDGGGVGQFSLVEGQPVRRLGALGVGADQPEADMVQFLQRGQRIVLAERFLAVHGLIAEVLQQPRLGEDGGADGGAEGGIVDQGSKIVLIGQNQRAVVFV